jgi:hypothetical protein
MVESICGQGFAYARKVEEERQKDLVKLEQKRATGKMAHDDAEANPKIRSVNSSVLSPFYSRLKFLKLGFEVTKIGAATVSIREIDLAMLSLAVPCE